MTETPRGCGAGRDSHGQHEGCPAGGAVARRPHTSGGAAAAAGAAASRGRLAWQQAGASRLEGQAY